MDFNEKLMKRIWSHIDKTDTCWLSNYKNHSIGGHTRIRINGRTCNFHRIMLFWSDQTKTTELADWKNWLACHNCRNPNCVNPSHLYWGTPDTNSKDKIRDGTTNKGEKNVNCKLTQIQVEEIRAKYATKKSPHSKDINYKTLALEYDVCWTTIQRIISRHTWSHLHA
jgi:hypothetical protein